MGDFLGRLGASKLPAVFQGAHLSQGAFHILFQIAHEAGVEPVYELPCGDARVFQKDVNDWGQMPSSRLGSMGTSARIVE